MSVEIIINPLINLHAERLRGFSLSYRESMFIPFSKEEKADPVISGIIARAAAEYARRLNETFEEVAKQLDHFEREIASARMLIEKAEGIHQGDCQLLESCNEQKRQGHAVINELEGNLQIANGKIADRDTKIIELDGIILAHEGTKA